jgi:hypothetical protein
MVVRAAQADDHVALRFFVANALNEAAAVDVTALECLEIDRATIFHVNRFGADLCAEQECCREPTYQK